MFFKDFDYILNQLFNINQELSYEEAKKVIEDYYSKIKSKKMVLTTVIVVNDNNTSKNYLPCTYMPSIVDEKYIDNFKNWTIFVDKEADDNNEYLIRHIPSYAQLIMPEEINQIFQKNGFEYVKIDFENNLVNSSKKIIEGHCRVLK